MLFPNCGPLPQRSHTCAINCSRQDNRRTTILADLRRFCQFAVRARSPNGARRGQPAVPIASRVPLPPQKPRLRLPSGLAQRPHRDWPRSRSFELNRHRETGGVARIGRSIADPKTPRAHRKSCHQTSSGNIKTVGLDRFESSFVEVDRFGAVANRKPSATPLCTFLPQILRTRLTTDHDPTFHHEIDLLKNAYIR
jgi:hypothetical protein